MFYEYIESQQKTFIETYAIKCKAFFKSTPLPNRHYKRTFSLSVMGFKDQQTYFLKQIHTAV